MQQQWILCFLRRWRCWLPERYKLVQSCAQWS